ncbi:MAG: outer membrane beta-barrel protein [Acetobacteraceae bacterium]
MTDDTRLRSGLSRMALGAGAVFSAISLRAIPAAHALTPPTPVMIDGGPLGQLQLSGGADGFAYALTGAGSDTSYGLLGTNKSAGFEFQNGLIQLQKAAGLVQFTLQAGATQSFVLGTKPSGTSVQTYATGPLRAAYVTLAPTPSFSISAGHIASVEGYESSIDWLNANMLATDIFAVENLQSTGVTASYTMGPVSATLAFGDGFDTQKWNFLQASVTATFNSSNSLSVYGATNLGTTGAGAHFYGSAATPYGSSFVGSGPLSAAPFVNSTMIGAYYSYTIGNLNLVPEVQYVYAKPNASVGLTSFSANLGAALFASYQFGKSPYSLGAWVQYFASRGPDNWFLNPGAQGFGLSISPTWQHEHLFVRGDLGVIHLTTIGTPGSSGYGSTAAGRNQATFLIEAGVLF